MEELKIGSGKCTKLIGCITHWKIDKSEEFMLGQGAQGKVFPWQKLTDSQSSWDYAWKEIPIEKFGDRTAEAVNNELQSQWKISQQEWNHLVKLVDFARSTRYYYMILERCQNDLKRLFYYKDQPLATTEQARKVLTHISKAILTLSQNELVHGDIKLGNILLTTKDLNSSTIFKLADFGMAVDISTEHRWSRGGTPYYQPIEALLCNPIVGTCGDIWSLGVTIHRMWTGRHPYNVQPKQANEINYSERLLQEINTNDLDIDPRLDAALREILSRMLEKDYNQRAKIDDVLSCKFLEPMFQEPTTNRLSVSSRSLSVSVIHNSQNPNEETLSKNAANLQDVQKLLNVLERILIVRDQFNSGVRRRPRLSELLLMEGRCRYQDLSLLIQQLSNPDEFMKQLQVFDYVLASPGIKLNDLCATWNTELQVIKLDLQDAKNRGDQQEFNQLWEMSVVLCEVMGDVEQAKSIEREFNIS